MKTYILTVEIDDSGSDEWWEEVRALPAMKARKEVAAEIGRALSDGGFVEPDSRVRLSCVVNK